MPLLKHNLFSNIPLELPEELSEVLWETPRVRIERIVSRGHVTPPDQWYDQQTDEWVVLLSGQAQLQLADQPPEQEDLLLLQPGDAVLLPAGLRHRVVWTESQVDCVWLALHVQPE